MTISPIAASDISTVFHGCGVNSLARFLAPFQVDAVFASVNLPPQGERCVELKDESRECKGTALGLSIRDGEHKGFYYIPCMSREESEVVAKRLGAYWF